MSSRSLLTLSWQTQLAVWTAFLPPLAALLTAVVQRRRWTWSDPLLQVAFCWLVMAVNGLIQVLRYVHYPVPAWLPTSYTAVMFPVLLLPATLGWIGPAARRWTWPLVIGWVLACLGLLWLVRDLRTFRILLQPIMAVGMTIASTLALASRAQHCRSRVMHEGWFWVLTAHVAYFGSDIIRQPLTETLVARIPEAQMPVHYAFLLLYTILYLMIARAMLLGDPRPAPPTRDFLTARSQLV